MDRQSEQTTKQETGGSAPQGVGTLVSGVLEDLQSLVRSEVQLAKSEFKEDATKIGSGVGMIAGGALVGLVGFIFLMLGVTYLLNKSVEMWIAAGIVGLVLILIAAIVAMSGKKKMSAASLKPDQTIDTMKENKEWANRQIKSVKK
ncbi:MAG: phage holin family protein [Thermomicrobiales bacterium]